MSTAVEPAENIDPPYQKKEEEEKDEGPKDFKFYIGMEAANDIFQNRWGLFSLIGAIPYAYHFVSAILGVDVFCSYTRFTGCVGATTFQEATEVYDSALMIICIFHIIEWIRQTVFVTVVLVGVPWLPVYFLLGFLNLPFGIIACIIAFAKGFSSEESCQ